MFNALINPKPVQRSEDGYDNEKSRSFDRSACNIVLILSEAIYLRLR